VARKLAQQLAASNVPQFDDPIFTGTDQSAAIGIEGQCGDRKFVFAKFRDQRFIGWVP
jgi:hypothetical protein